MIRAILQKEWQQHRSWLVILGLISACIVLLASFSVNATGTGAGILTGLAYGLWLTIPIAGLVLSHLFVYTEYQQKTQLFLEGLPVSRWKMITLKQIICMSCICLYAIGAVGLGLLISLPTEVLTARFIGIMLSCACGWALFVMGFFFVTGFLGRYRIIIIVMLVITLIAIGTMTSIPIGEFPPLALIDIHRFGLEREIYPIQDLKWTGIIVIGLVVFGFVIGNVKEGSVASMLGEKMSYREKMFVGGTAGIIATCLMVFSKGPKPEPFSTPGAVHEQWQGVNVYVSSENPEQPTDLEISIASKLARRLAKQRDWLGIPPELFPTIFVIERSDLEEVERIDWENVDHENIVKMYAGIRQPEFSEDRLLSWTLSHVLDRNSFRKLGRDEDRWWIVCGLEGLWELEQADQETIEKRIQMAVKSVDEHGLTLENLMGWFKYQDDVEWRHADAVAWMGMRHLVELKGLDSVQKLATATVTKRFTRKDSRAVFWDYAKPVKPAFKATTSISLEEFVKSWRQYILSFKTSEPKETSPTKQ